MNHCIKESIRVSYLNKGRVVTKKKKKFELVKIRTSAEVSKAIFNINLGKAPGLSGVSSKIFKCFQTNITWILLLKKIICSTRRANSSLNPSLTLNFVMGNITILNQRSNKRQIFLCDPGFCWLLRSSTTVSALLAAAHKLYLLPGWTGELEQGLPLSNSTIS